MDREARRAWWRSRYDLLVILCLVDYALLVLVDSERFFSAIAIVPIFITIVVAQRTTGQTGVIVWIGRVAIGFGALLAVASAVTPSHVVEGLSTAGFAIALLLCFVAVYLHVLQQTEANLQTMYAALTCYLLVGIFFTLADITLALWFPPFFHQGGPHPPADYAYFSFITMTTVGYGDLTPYVGYPRSMAVLEAVIGQMVLVTLVARTVASVSANSWRERRIVRRADERGEPGES
jgi:Ion channel